MTEACGRRLHPAPWLPKTICVPTALLRIGKQLAVAAKKPAPPSDDCYRLFVAALKERALAARTSATRTVNRDLILLCWNLGRAIVEQLAAQGRGDSVLKRLAADRRREFPGMSGFSTPNVWRMLQIYRVHTPTEFLSQAVG